MTARAAEIHLYHYALSNCSQRVRLLLEEKGLPWVSHHIDLSRDEHLSKEFLAINPQGLVPALVHGDTRVCDSHRILEHLESAFPEPSFTPEDPTERSLSEARLGESERVQNAIRALSHEYLFKPYRQPSTEDLVRYATFHPDDGLVEFLRVYSAGGEAWEKLIDSARQEIDDFLQRLERALAAAPWLSGSACGLADIAWSVNILRLDMANYGLALYPALSRWLSEMKRRPAFVRAVSQYHP